jgi:callose synthase
MLSSMSLPFLFSLTANPVSILLKQIAIAWKRIVWSLGLWDSVREFARMYDAGMGVLIFVPIAFLSWFPFVSTFQSRLLFNQAFSRGLEISLILAGNKANVEI